MTSMKFLPSHWQQVADVTRYQVIRRDDIRINEMTYSFSLAFQRANAGRIDKWRHVATLQDEAHGEYAVLLLL